MFNKAYARGVTETMIRAGLVKFASVQDAEKIADEVGEALNISPLDGPVTQEKTAAVIVAVLEKVAGTGSLITGDKPAQKNTPANAASQVGGLGALDQKDRPQGTYAKGEKGVGKTDLPYPAGSEIGKEQPHPKAPTKSASDLSLNELIRKVASGTGSLITGDDAKQENTPSNAASQVGGLAALDEKERPQGTYAKGEQGVGKTEQHTEAGEVGKTEPHPESPKSAAYISRFQETAQAYVQHLPKGLNDNEKVAAVKYLMGCEPSEAHTFLFKLAEEEYKELADLKSELKGHEKKDEKEEKKEEKKDEKMEAKKESAVRRPSATLAALLAMGSK